MLVIPFLVFLESLNSQSLCRRGLLCNAHSSRSFSLVQHNFTSNSRVFLLVSGNLFYRLFNYALIRALDPALSLLLYISLLFIKTGKVSFWRVQFQTSSWIFLLQDVLHCDHSCSLKFALLYLLDHLFVNAGLL